MSSIFHLPQNIRSEFSIDEFGKTYATQSGVARLCGVSQSAINQLLEVVDLIQKRKINPDLEIEGFVGCLYDGRKNLHSSRLFVHYLCHI